MPYTYAGFDGTYTETSWGQTARHLGALVPVVAARDGLVCTTSATRTTSVGLGTSWAHGVSVTTDAVANLTHSAVTTVGATRWDAVVLRRNWSTNSATLLVVEGVAASPAPQQLPSGLNDTPGSLHDQVLALVQITYNTAAPTALVDMRTWASKAHSIRTAAALPAPSALLFGLEMRLDDGTLYRCELNGSTYVWKIQTPTVPAPVTSGIATGVTNWTLSTQWGQVVNGSRFVRLQFIYTGSDITSGAAGSAGPGNISDVQIATMTSEWAPPNNMNSGYRAAICGGQLEIRTTANGGGVWLTDLYTSGLIRNGDALSFSTSYPVLV